MSYKNNRIFHYGESGVLELIKKPHIFYLLCSYCFWFIIIGITWAHLFDSKIFNAVSLYKITSFSSILTLIVYFSSLCGLCILTGTILSIPAIICRNLLDCFVAREQKKYKRVVNLVLLAQYLPYVFLILSNVIFYQINISTEIYQDFLYNSKLKQLKNTYAMLGKHNPDGRYIFLIPEYLIENQNTLKKTKALLPFQGSFFMETSAKPEMVAQLMQKESENISQYYAFVPMHQTTRTHASEQFFHIGIDRQHSFELFELFGNHIVEKKPAKLTKNLLLINHTIPSLKPLHLFIKSNFLGLLSRNWRWDNFGNTSLDILLTYGSQKQTTQYNLLILSNPKHTKNTLLFGSMDFIKPSDISKIEDTLDINLHTVIKALLEANVTNIFILPYRSELQHVPLSKFISSIDFNDKMKSYRTLLKNDSEFICKSQLVQNIPDPVSLLKDALNHKLRFEKHGEIYLSPMYDTYIKEFFINTLICYDHGENIYLIKLQPKYANEKNYNTFMMNTLDVYKFNHENNTKILSEKEKSEFFDKYQYAIFKS